MTARTSSGASSMPVAHDVVLSAGVSVETRSNDSLQSPQPLVDMKFAGALTFSDDGVLFVGDNHNGAIYAFEIRTRRRRAGCQAIGRSRYVSGPARLDETCPTHGSGDPLKDAMPRRRQLDSSTAQSEQVTSHRKAEPSNRDLLAQLRTAGTRHREIGPEPPDLGIGL